MSGDSFSQFFETVVLNRSIHICAEFLCDKNMILQAGSLDDVEAS